MRHRRALNAAENDSNDKAVDSFLNYETVKYFTAEKHEVDRYRKALANYGAHAETLQLSLSVLTVGQAFIVTLGMTSVMLIAAYQVKSGNITVGDFVLINTFIAQLYVPLNFLGTSYKMVKQYLTDLENMFELLEETPEVGADELETVTEVKSGEIRFENVQFGYENENGVTRPILKGVSFTVPSGNQLAIVGPSGGGKTTINRLLFRFYDPTAGKIFIDSKDISTMNQRILRKSVGIVPQDTVLFNDTIDYNIRYGDFEATEGQVMEAARTANILERIEEFPEGWATKVGERGLRLSGGEKQRVSIARCILKNPRIVVFDEATASLDVRSERAIQANLKSAFRGKKITRIVLAHRLSTIVDSDEIIVLKDGVIIEQGTHEQLLKLGGEYQSMWSKQISSSADTSNIDVDQAVEEDGPE